MYKAGFLSRNEICPSFLKSLKKETFKEEELNTVAESEK